MNITNNTILYNSKAEDMLDQIDDQSIDLTIFSPPYDNIRDYHKFPFDLNLIGEKLFSKTKDGGIAVCLIQDGTKDFCKSGTSFRTAVSWMNSGWKLFETLIYHRHGRPGAWWNKRFRVDHEYIFVFFKGDKPKFFDKEHLKIPAKHAGKKWHGTQRLTSGKTIPIAEKEQKANKCRGTVWFYDTSNTEGNKTKMKHPATYPDKFVEDHILTWTEEGDTICDFFAGSGTTGIMAEKLKRKCILSEPSKEYCEIIKERYKNEITGYSPELF